MKFHAYWGIFGLKMAILDFFGPFLPLLLYRENARQAIIANIPSLTVSALTFDPGILVTTVRACWKAN